MSTGSEWWTYHYRHAIEQLARRSGVSELDIARRVVEYARAAAQTGNMRAAHIGYTLIDAGRAVLEAEIGYHPTQRQMVQRIIQRHPAACYLGALALGTAAGVAAGLQFLGNGSSAATPSGEGHNSTPRLRGTGQAGAGSRRLVLAALLTLPASAVAKEVLERWLYLGGQQP